MSNSTIKHLQNISTWSGLCVCCGLAALPMPSAFAQPPARSMASGANVPQIENDWKVLRAEVGSQEFTDTQTAINRYQQFFEQRGGNSGVTAIEISSTIAQLYWQVLDNQQKALTIYDWAIKNYGYLPQSSRLKTEREWVANAGSFKTTVDASPLSIDIPSSKTASVNPVPIKILSQDSPSVPNPVITVSKSIPSQNKPASSVLTPVVVDTSPHALKTATPQEVKVLSPTSSSVSVQLVNINTKESAQPNLEPVVTGLTPQDNNTATPATIKVHATPTSFVAVNPVHEAVDTPQAPLLSLTPVLINPAQSATAKSQTPDQIKVNAGQVAAGSSTLPDAVHVSSAPTEPPVNVPDQVTANPTNNANQTRQTPSPVNLHTVALAALAAQWREGKVTLDELYQQKLLTADDALLMLSAPGIITKWKEDVALRLALVTFVQEHAPELLTSPDKLPPPTQLALAEYYTSQRSPKGEKVYQELLSHKIPGGVWWNEIMIRNAFAVYYGDMGEFDKAAQAKLDIGNHTKDEEWLSNIKVEAARYYIQAGETAKAQALYEKAEKSTYGWAVGVAMYDQGRELISEEKYDEAIKVLSQPVQGHYSDQVKVGLITLLGYCYYRQGKFDQAKQYCQQALDQYKALSNPLKNEGIEGSLTVAQEVIEWIPKWVQSPIICSPDHLDVVVDAEDKHAGTISRQMGVRTNKPASFLVTSDNPLITAHVDDLQNVASNDWLATPLSYYAQSKLIVETGPAAAEKGLDASLVVQSKSFPNFILHIPIHVEKEGGVQPDNN